MRNKRKTKVSIHTWMQTILGIVAIFFAAISYCSSEKSIKISLNALEDANKQHKQDSSNSEFTFRTQLAQAETLNSKLIYQIQTLQKITDNQLQNSDLQIIELKKLSKPDISLEEIYIRSNEFHFTIKNIGKRTAFNITYQLLGINETFTNYEELKNEKIFNRLFANNRESFSCKDYDNDSICYLFLSIYFFDRELKANRNVNYYYENTGGRVDDMPMSCKNDVIQKIDSLLKKRGKGFKIIDN